ncbi:hypothetical protein JX265_001374 [Neoarthrinium moseri]|uniref:LysM domain-containing protein n=1 Tax=Neoarthrinium moseri TaxID=1658444 RepID=A0A9P9WY43_9PEZI|nr:uncharacterized protein JN550_004089 [Neoarthrinium moseri]KAI1850413.1 hypothetical protein JX266_004271 [Neoarthrinium moseri]KAI1872370.1 hypothetical protein JN550_004089 [Neoarthrinium moseri]KAI1881134.1 hypothetical protein JX265_001374 [Neoarthrinium moseri]
MILSFGLSLAVLSTLGAAQFTVDPPTNAAPDTIKDCTYWQVATANDTCSSISESWGLTLEQFYTYNPSLADGCVLVVGDSYCIEQNWGIPPPSPTPTSSSVISTTQKPTPTPTTILEACEAEAGGYADSCPRCLSHCEGSSDLGMCFYSVYSTVNYYDSQCWQHGGNDCANKALDIVCPKST